MLTASAGLGGACHGGSTWRLDLRLPPASLPGLCAQVHQRPNWGLGRGRGAGLPERGGRAGPALFLAASPGSSGPASQAGTSGRHVTASGSWAVMRKGIYGCRAAPHSGSRRKVSPHARLTAATSRRCPAAGTPASPPPRPRLRVPLAVGVHPAHATGALVLPALPTRGGRRVARATTSGSDN